MTSSGPTRTGACSCCVIPPCRSSSGARSTLGAAVSCTGGRPTPARAGAPVTERAPHLVRAVTAWDPAVAAELVEAAERIGAADPARAAHWLAAVLALLPDTPEHRATWRDLTLRRAQALGSAKPGGGEPGPPPPPHRRLPPR